RAAGLVAAAAGPGMILRLVGPARVGMACDETTTVGQIRGVWAAFGADVDEERLDVEPIIPAELRRESEYLTHPVFHRHRSETAMLRYLRSLAEKDYARDRGMIPLGPRTMQLNATTQMEPVPWPE